MPLISFRPNPEYFQGSQSLTCISLTRFITLHHTLDHRASALCSSLNLLSSLLRPLLPQGTLSPQVAGGLLTSCTSDSCGSFSGRPFPSALIKMSNTWLPLQGPALRVCGGRGNRGGGGTAALLGQALASCTTGLQEAFLLISGVCLSLLLRPHEGVGFKKCLGGTLPGSEVASPAPHGCWKVHRCLSFQEEASEWPSWIPACARVFTCSLGTGGVLPQQISAPSPVPSSLQHQPLLLVDSATSW